LMQEDMQQLHQLVSEKNIFVISDEVYEHLIFDELPHHSVLRYPELLERSFVCFSFGKVYNCTGWKLGYCVAPQVLMKEFRKVHQFNCFTCDTPKQVALAEFLKHRDHYLSLGKTLQQKRDHFAQLMASTKLKALPSYGSYFQCYSYKHLSNESEMDFAKRLTIDHGVTTIPVSAFYSSGADNGVLRFCF
jgi:methionine transaminase